MENAPVLQNLRKKTKLGQAASLKTSLFSLFWLQCMVAKCRAKRGRVVETKYARSAVQWGTILHRTGCQGLCPFQCRGKCGMVAEFKCRAKHGTVGESKSCMKHGMGESNNTPRHTGGFK